MYSVCGLFFILRSIFASATQKPAFIIFHTSVVMIVFLKQGWSWQEIDVNGSLWRCVYQCLCSLGLYSLTWHCRWQVFVRSLLHDRSFVCVFVDWHGCYRLDQHRYHFVHIGTQHRYQQKKGCRLIKLSPHYDCNCLSYRWSFAPEGPESGSPSRGHSSRASTRTKSVHPLSTERN